MCKLRIIEVFLCAKWHVNVAENMSYVSPESCTRYRIVRKCMRHGRTGFKRSHFNAVKPTAMLQNSDFTYSY